MSISLRTAVPHIAARREVESANAGRRARETSTVDTFERTGTLRVIDASSEDEAVAHQTKVGAGIGVAGSIGLGALFFISPLAAAITSVGLLAATVAYLLFSKRPSS